MLRWCVGQSWHLGEQLYRKVVIDSNVPVIGRSGAAIVHTRGCWGCQSCLGGKIKVPMGMLELISGSYGWIGVTLAIHVTCAVCYDVGGRRGSVCNIGVPVDVFVVEIYVLH